MNTYISGDSGGEVSILGGDSLRLCEEKKFNTNMCLILNGYQARAVWMYRCKCIVNGNK